MSKNIIEAWMIQTIKDDSWKNNNDLHIDIISSKFQKPENWLIGGLKCLEKAISIRNQLKEPFIVELFIELKADTKPIGINFQTLDTLKNEIAWTPPSLYLFNAKYSVWIKSMKKVTYVNLSDFKSKNIKCIYNEILKDDPEYYRYVGFISMPK